MNHSNISIISFIVLMALVMTGCRNLREKTIEENLPDILFVQDNYYAQVSNQEEVGTYIDKEGNIREFYFEKDAFINSEKSFYDFLKEQNSPVIDNIDKEELLRYYKTFLKISKKYELKEYPSCVDAIYGLQEWGGFRFNKDDKVEFVMIYGTGERLVINTDEHAKEVQPWIFKKLPTSWDTNGSYNMEYYNEQ